MYVNVTICVFHDYTSSMHLYEDSTSTQKVCVKDICLHCRVDDETARPKSEIPAEKSVKTSGEKRYKGAA